MTGIPALAPLFEGVLAPYAAVLRLPAADQQARPATDLLHPSVLDEVLAQYRPDGLHRDPRALLSLWSQYYFLRLLPPVLAANLIMDRALPLELDGMEVIIGDDGLPAAFVLPDEGAPFETGTSVRARFQVLGERHMAPLINAWTHRARLSERVLWGNAGRYLDWMLTQFQELGQPPQVWSPLYDWLNMADDGGGRPNPLYKLYRYCPRSNGEPLHRVRRTCCIRYRLPDISICPECPRLCGRQSRSGSSA